MTRHHRRDEAGAILVLTSILALTLLTFTAYSVDIGHESEVKRHLHVVADVAAQDGLYGLGGTSALTNVANLAVAGAAHNGHPLGGSNTLTVEIGQWTGTPRTFQSLSPPCIVSLPGVIPSCAAAGSANADRVVAGSKVIWNFVSGSQGLSATAVAGAEGETGLEIGSYDASATLTTSQVGFLNGELGVNAVSYDGLAGANIKLGDLASQLGFGSVNALLAGSTTYGQLLSAGARSLTNQGDTTAGARLAAISAALATGGTGNVKSGSTLPMSRFLKRSVSSNGAGSFGEGSVLAASGGIDALGLVTSGYDAALMDGSSFATIKSLNLTIPNVASVDAGVKVISAPSTDFGPACNVTTQEPGDLAACAQVKTSQIEGQIVAHLPPVVVPIPLLGNATITADIPLYFDNAAAHAWISYITCAGPLDRQANVDAWARTGLVHFAIGQNAALAAATYQQDLSNSLAGSVGITAPDGSTVTVSGATFAEISIPALSIDVKVANNGTVTVLGAGPSLLQPTSPPPNPAVPSYSGPFLKPTGGSVFGYRGPDKIAAATFTAGAGVTPVNPTGNGVQDALTSLANSVPSLQTQLDLQLAGLVAKATVDTALGPALSAETATINSVISSLGQTVFAPLGAAFEADIGGAVVTNLTARDQSPPDGTICIPGVVQ